MAALLFLLVTIPFTRWLDGLIRRQQAKTLGRAVARWPSSSSATCTRRSAPTTVLRGIDLDVELHQVVCLIGASGSGKSTLLRCINQLETIDDGVIRLGGDRVSGRGIDVDALRREVGIVFQSFNLFPHMTVLENITLAPVKVLGLHARSWPRSAASRC